MLDTEGDDNADGNSRERDRESVAAMEKWSSYVERYSTPTGGQTSPKDSHSLPDNEPPTTNQPVSSDQAARGGRGRKRKNTNTTDINKKV